uniref:Uncharacterized protein n=1 Tax=Arundo donax TaxID=35708 RepID=A0A0A8YZW6_ARUDO
MFNKLGVAKFNRKICAHTKMQTKMSNNTFTFNNCKMLGSNTREKKYEFVQVEQIILYVGAGAKHYELPQHPLYRQGAITFDLDIYNLPLIKKYTCVARMNF